MKGVNLLNQILKSRSLQKGQFVRARSRDFAGVRSKTSGYQSFGFSA